MHAYCHSQNQPVLIIIITNRENYTGHQISIVLLLLYQYSFIHYVNEKHYKYDNLY